MLPERRRRDDATHDLVTVHDPSGAASEAYRMLRTNLFYALIDSPPKVIVLTSANLGEGKSTTAANLGVTLAQAGKNVLILDCDLRRPRLHSMFGVNNTRGLVDILAGGNRIEEVWREPIPGVKLICAGPPPPNPAELLSSRRLAEFLAEMRAEVRLRPGGCAPRRGVRLRRAGGQRGRGLAGPGFSGYAQRTSATGFALACGASGRTCSERS